MVENVKLKEENRIEKIKKNAETRMAVYIYIYIVYCHLENKNSSLQNAKYNFNLETIKLNNKSKDRAILKKIWIEILKIFVKIYILVV